MDPDLTHPTTDTATSAQSLRRARADRLAMCLYEQLRDRPIADRRFVFRALVGRLAAFASDERVDVALRSLSACCDAHGGKSVSRRDYDAWRATQSDPREFASSSFIRAVFGSWTKALEALGHDSAGDVRARGLVSRGGRWSRAELIKVLQTFAPADDSPLSVSRYLRSARAHNGGLRPGEPRAPSDVAPFYRVFGSWTRALKAAGVPSWDAATATAQRWERGSRAHYTPERMLEWIRRAAHELGTDYLTADAYDAWAQRTRDAAAERGDVLLIPRQVSVVRKLGTWTGVLRMAGLGSDDPDRFRAARGWYTDDAVLNAVRRALRHFGGRPTMEAYDRWRQEILAGSPAPRSVGLPPARLVGSRLGWRDAFDRAAAGDVELPALSKAPMTDPSESLRTES